MKIYMYILIILFLLFPVRTAAQVIESLNPGVPGSLYLDIATALLVGNVSINYEAPLHNQMLLRIGFGVGYYLEWEAEDATSSGLLAMMNVLTSGSSSRFEIGAGGSINRIYEDGNMEWKVLPAFDVGYRYQAYSGGFVFRVGLGYTFAFGYPFYISTGFTL